MDFTDVSSGGNEAGVKKSDSKTHLNGTTTKVYKYRWVILLLFSISSALNGFQWIQYSIISNIIQRYYNVSSGLVNWMSMVYMVAYIPFTFPSVWLMDKVGLRVVTTLGAVGNFAAAWIKVVSVAPDRFYVSFIGQAVAATAQMFILNAPARLAAVWFGPNEVSTACALGVFGNQIGNALGFLLPPIMVHNHTDISDIGTDLSIMFYILAGCTSVQLVLIIFLFRAEPPLPPSLAQADRANDISDFSGSLKRLICNPGYVLLLLSYGISMGVFGAVSTLLNQMVLIYFPGHEQDAGRIGLTLMLAGMSGSVISGIILDKTHRFKETTMGLYFFALVGMVAFTFTLRNAPIAVVYVIAGLLGFFMTGYVPVGFEFAAEITYPEPEGTSAGILNGSMQVFGILLTMMASKLLNEFGDLWSNLGLAMSLLVGLVLTGLIKPNLKRQAAQVKGQTYQLE